MKKYLWLLVLLATFLGCANTQAVMPKIELGDTAYYTVVTRAGSLFGSNMCTMDVFGVKEGKAAAVYHTSASTGGAVDSLVGVGNMLKAAAAAAPAAETAK